MHKDICSGKSGVVYFMKIVLNYRDAEDLMRGAGIYGSPSDVYGLLMGLIAAGFREDGRDFEELVRNLVNDGEQFPRNVRTWLRETVSGIIEQYLSGEGMHLLLPGDGTPAMDRAACLIELAHGFLTGFSCRKPGGRKLSREAQEFLSDLDGYCRASSEAEDGEEFEDTFVTLTDHLSAGAQICFEECAGSLYPKANAGEDFVLEDDDGGAPVRLSPSRENIHNMEEAGWERKTRTASGT